MQTPPHRTRRRLQLCLGILVATAATLLGHPPTVIAGTYTVHSCQTPTGRWTGMGGWTSDGGASMLGYDSGSATPCTPSSDASLQFGGTLPAASGNWTSWDFIAPPDTTIASYTIERAFSLSWPVVPSTANRPYVLHIWRDDEPTSRTIDLRAPLQGQTYRQELSSDVSGQGLSWASLHVGIRCWGVVGSLDCGPFPARVTIPRAAIGLRDEEAPVGAATGGALAGAAAVRGVGNLSFQATDDGGGVYRVAVSVDGDEVSREVVDDDHGSCADVEPATQDPYEFASPQPCPLAVDGAVQLDTASLRDGGHAVRVTVEDAAGNEDVVLDTTLQTHNAPINAAVPGLSGSAAVGAQLAATTGQWDGAPTGYDHRWLRCDANGAACAPVPGADGPTYVLTDDDAYHRMRVEVTAENAGGPASARSAPSALVADRAGRTAPPDANGGGGGRSGGGGGDPDPDPGPGGIQGLVNPLDQLPGHVGNGSPATTRARIEAAFQRADGSTAKRVASRHGRRWTIVGRLVDAQGAGIADAQLGAAWKVGARGWVARPGVRTGADGRFVYVLPPGPSRAVRFTYFAFSDSHAVELSNVVRIDVRAPVTIRADRRTVTGARIVRLSGRVGGGSLPRGGALVTLQGFQKGFGWRTFRTVRTDRKGAWRTSYRFRLTSGRFGFRAVVPRQSGLPYATTTSSGVFVVVS